MLRIVACLSALLIAASHASAGELTFTVHGLNVQKGSIAVRLVSAGHEKQWNEKTLGKIVGTAEQRFLVQGESQTFVFKNIPDGIYALRFFHDENDNGELDTNFIGIPKEGYGFSNDARGIAGPPSFKAASFTVEGKNTLISAKVSY